MKCLNNNNAVLNVEHSTTMYANQMTKKSLPRPSIIERFFQCYCVVKNSSIITTDSLGTDSIEVIHGMRYRIILAKLLHFFHFFVLKIQI